MNRRASVTAGRRSRWRLFLPKLPDVVALLAIQGDHSVAGMDAFARWSQSGEIGEADAMRASQQEAYDARRQLLTSLQAVMSSPIDQEDLYVLSERVDRVLTQARHVLREAEVLRWSPNASTAAMGAKLASGTRALAGGCRLLVKNPKEAGSQADEAANAVHHVERDYRLAMADLLDRQDDLRTVLAAQDIYRRYLQVAEATVAVADRLWYAVLRGA
jgi:uncharacterized protein Yka (UPF0111/DUF47 family)